MDDRPTVYKRMTEEGLTLHSRISELEAKLDRAEREIDELGRDCGRFLEERNLAQGQRDDLVFLLHQAQTEREDVSDQHDAECDRLERERDQARSIVGRLMFRFAQGFEGDPWRKLAEWIPRVEKEARRAWEDRKKEHLDEL